MKSIFTFVLFFVCFTCFAQVTLNSTQAQAPNSLGAHNSTVLFSDLAIFQRIVFDNATVVRDMYIEVVGRVEESGISEYPYLLVCPKGSFYIGVDGQPYILEDDSFTSGDYLF